MSSSSASSFNSEMLHLAVWLTFDDEPELLKAAVEKASTLTSIGPQRTHITIASGDAPIAALDGITASFQSLEEQLTSFSVELSNLTIHPSAKFRCVYALVEMQSQLSSSRLAICQTLGIDPNASTFFPHISLCYDPTSSFNSEAREQILMSLGMRLLKGLSMNVSGVELWDVTDPQNPSSWKMLDSVQLSDGSTIKRHKASALSSSIESNINLVEETEAHYSFLRHCNQLADDALLAGNLPFGACLVMDKTIQLSSQDASINPKYDITQHAELRLVSQATSLFSPIRLKQSILYCSSEPCVMCAGAIMLAGVSKVVFCCSSSSLKRFKYPSVVGSCRETFGMDPKSKIGILGPLLEDEGLALHDKFLQTKFNP